MFEPLKIYCSCISVGEGVRERAVVSDILDDMWEKLLAVATVREELQHFRYL